MKKLSLVFVLLFICVFLSSCSSAVDFTTVNYSPYVRDGEECRGYRVAVPDSVSDDDLLAIFKKVSKDSYYLHTVWFFASSDVSNTAPFAIYDETQKGIIEKERYSENGIPTSSGIRQYLDNIVSSEYDSITVSKSSSSSMYDISITSKSSLYGDDDVCKNAASLFNEKVRDSRVSEYISIVSVTLAELGGEYKISEFSFKE